MSYYQNGQYYRPSSSHQHYRHPSFDAGDEAGLMRGNGTYAQGGGPGRRGSLAVRQQDELFMAEENPPLEMPSAPDYAAQYQTPASPSQPTYDPRAYAAPVQIPNPQSYGGLNRTQYTPTSSHQPYNPAAYSDNGGGLVRSDTRRYGYQAANFTPTSPFPATPQQVSFPSPSVPQQGQYSPSRAQSGYGHRASISSPVYPPPTGSAPLPARPGHAPPSQSPLPMPPHSAGMALPADWQAEMSRHSSINSRYTQWPVGGDMNSRYNNPLPSPPENRVQEYYPDEMQYASPMVSPNPLPPTPGPPPPQHAPRRSDTTSSRPLPPPPPEAEEEYFGRPNGNGTPFEDSGATDELYDEIENAVMHAGSPRHQQNPRIDVENSYDNQTSANGNEPPFYASLAGGEVAATNGSLSPPRRVGGYDYSDESDVEAAAGLAAMQMADEEERRANGGSGLFSSYSTIRPTPQPPEHQEPLEMEDDDDKDDSLAGIDLSAYGMGYEPSFSYGGDPAELASGHTSLNRSESQSHTISSSGSLRKSGDTSETDAYDPIHPFPPFSSTARVDTFGTGGFAEPTTQRRRLSYDEGDESSLMEPNAPAPGEPPDMFYHPGMSAAHSRPLPPTPGGERFAQTQPPWNYQANRVTYPQGPDAMVTPVGGHVPRSTSLINQRETPQAVPPIRSKTDAEERRLRNAQARTSALYEKDIAVETSTPASASTIALDLPSLPAGKRFNPAKLDKKDFAKCIEPWALSSIIEWLRMMTEGETDLREHSIFDGLVALFIHKVPNMNTADAEALSTQVVAEMFKVGTLEHVEEWLKFTPATTSGVLYQLTQAGCYAPRLHDDQSTGRCYSYHCQRTVKKIDLHATPSVKSNVDWATFHGLTAEFVGSMNKKEVERQNILHEIVQTEDNYMEQLNILRVLYRDALSRQQPPIISPKKLKAFLRDVFGKIDGVIQADQDHLLPQLKYREMEHAPVVKGFSDIFREWIRKARHAYIEYAGSFPYASFLIRQESERNILFSSFLEQVRSNKASNKLAWDHYLKNPITRLQHIGLLLQTAHKRSIIDDPEKKNLQVAIDEIKAVTLECDARVAEMSRKVDLTDLQSKLILRPGMQRVELNLNHLGRELIFKGDLQRMGGTRYTWLETHALLFDHYLVLAKTVHHREHEGGPKQERYDVSRLPIPMDLLVLESSNDDPVVRSSVKGVTAAGVTRSAGTPDSRLRSGSNAASPAAVPLSHTNTGSSAATMITSTVLEAKDEKIMYPFRIKHLGKEVYTLFAPSAQNRQEWCQKILEAKTKHAASLYAQNAEPFRLSVMADSAFSYEGAAVGSQSITIEGTPLDRAIDEVETRYANTGRPGPICRAKVNCATTFMQPYGKPMVAVGTDFGVYISETDNPRGWLRAIPVVKVTQIAVLEEFSMFLLISDKALIAYHLDMVCPVGGVPPANDSARKAPQKLSGARDVGFFATGKMKDRTLVFYKKREGLSSTFKVLEPVFQKAEKKRGFFRSGRTEFFREYDDFYIPTECYGLNLFHSSLAISTSKGFEVLTLDKKQPWSVPDLKQQHVATIASRLQGLDPLGMFRLSDAEFLLCYEECAVYVNKHGEVSRSVIMEFVGKAKAAALYGPYVLLFDPDFVEIRNAQNGRLRQVIPGRDVKCLDDGLGLGGQWAGYAHGGQGGYVGAPHGGVMGMGASGVGGRTVKLALQHPRYERCQIVVELLLNEGQHD
ncbi:uncharacterized protein K452DRAFT_233289 [Aplosporella prunicola CBS 121167]|uniref:DH domain-containing protein n=1 Tax=Aplosporella prunicola CBS 121167 TaxID=1176127 RepID=A0A6A6B5F4_9PEZI|nr:uncharacterized protein K452DRAFT_233289 [Aplosporella prunicola CBS 121167]KAF2139076.1 hypothetical protein K452DRAFT_233289 [Aplosporella prunicola CBS 121167]